MATEFEQGLQGLENVVPTDVWNKLTDAYESIQIKVRKSLKILNETAVLPDPGKRRRRNSDYILDIIIPENCTETLSDDEDCILSSTLFDEDPAAAENRSLAKDLAKVKTEIFRNSFNLEPGTSDF